MARIYRCKLRTNLESFSQVFACVMGTINTSRTDNYALSVCMSMRYDASFEARSETYEKYFSRVLQELAK